MTYREMNTPLGVDVDQQFIFRHRLQKKNPACVKDCEADTHPLFCRSWRP